jgi:cytochrome c553
MLDHQRAADLMFQGLVVPSSTLWREGADTLNVARLRDRELPRDSRWTPEIVRAEERLHRFAGDAARMHDYATRAASYAQIIATCAECHGLHQKVWGPPHE